MIEHILNEQMIQTTIKKSKFISFSFSLSGKNYKDILENLRKKYYDATHICYAYRDGNIEKFSDDGEPQGTAGKPILECIKKANIDNMMVVVVRYFGGVKLGASGLLRAYSNCASEVLKKSGTKTVENCIKLELCCDVADSKKIAQISKILAIKKIEISYSTKVIIDLILLKEKCDEVKEQLESLFNRKIEFKILNNEIFF